MQKYLFSFFTIVTSAFSYAQNYSWVKTIVDNTTATTILPNGDVITLGRNTSDNFICKINKNGQLLWTKTFATANTSVNLTSDNNSNIYLTGIIFSQNTPCDLEPGIGVTTYSAAGNSLFVEKLDSAGNKIWINTYQLGSYSIISPPNITVSQTTGKVAIAGQFYGNIDFDPLSAAGLVASSVSYVDRYIAVLNSSGIYQVSNSISLGGRTGWFTCKFDNNDMIIVGGEDHANGKRFCVAKYDASLNQQWYYTGTSTPANGANAGGSVTDLAINIDNSIIAIGEDSLKTTVVKIGSNGNVVWRKKFDDINIQTSSVGIGLQDEIMIAGYFLINSIVDVSPDGITNNTEAPYGGKRGVLLKLTSTGNYLNHRLLSCFNDTDIEMYDIAFRDSVIVGCGIKGFFGAPDFDSETLGNQNDGFNSTTGYVVKWSMQNMNTTSISDLKKMMDINLYPNPSTNFIYFEKEYDYIITNAIGQTVHQGKGNFADISELVNDVYFIKLENDKGLRTLKFIKQ